MKNYLPVNFVYLVKKMGLSQDEFGSTFGLNRGNMGQYIREVSVPKLETLQRIAQHFEITLDELVNTDLSTKNKIVEKHLSVSEPSSNYDKDKYISQLEYTIEIQKQYIENLKSQLGAAS